jgi:hypothetical protein
VGRVAQSVSDWIRAGWSGDRIPVGARFFASVQTGPGALPASCTMGTGSFLAVESGRGVTLTPHPLLVPRSKNRVGLYLYSPEGPSWPVVYTTFVWRRNERDMIINVRSYSVKCPLFLSGLNDTELPEQAFKNNWRLPNCSMRTDRQTSRRTDMTRQQSVFAGLETGLKINRTYVIFRITVSISVPRWTLSHVVITRAVLWDLSSDITVLKQFIHVLLLVCL